VREAVEILSAALRKERSMKEAVGRIEREERRRVLSKHPYRQQMNRNCHCLEDENVRATSLLVNRIARTGGGHNMSAESLSNVLERMDTALTSMPYVQSQHAVCKVNAKKQDTLLARWEGGFTPDGKEHVKGSWPHIPYYTEIWAYDGKHLFSYCPEQKSGCILKYGDSFNLRRGPRALLGGLYENRSPLRLSQFLAGAEYARMNVETLGGLKTFRIEGQVEYETGRSVLRAWVAPERDYLPVRSALADPRTGIEKVVMTLDRWEKVDGRWFPVEARVEVYALTPKEPEGVEKWPQKDVEEYFARRESWEVKPLAPEFEYEKVVVTNVKVLPKAPEGVFDIAYPRGARVLNTLAKETITVGAPKSAFDVGTDFGQQTVSGVKLAEAAENKLQQARKQAAGSGPAQVG
jgi:hypothetical protein